MRALPSAGMRALPVHESTAAWARDTHGKSAVSQPRSKPDRVVRLGEDDVGAGRGWTQASALRKTFRNLGIDDRPSGMATGATADAANEPVTAHWPTRNDERDRSAVGPTCRYSHDRSYEMIARTL